MGTKPRLAALLLALACATMSVHARYDVSPNPVRLTGGASCSSHRLLIHSPLLTPAPASSPLQQDWTGRRLQQSLWCAQIAPAVCLTASS